MVAVTALCQRCPQKAPTRPATAASKRTPQRQGAVGCSGPGHLQGTCEAGLNLQHKDPQYPQDPQDPQDSQDHAEPQRLFPGDKAGQQGLGTKPPTAEGTGTVCEADRGVCLC